MKEIHVYEVKFTTAVAHYQAKLLSRRDTAEFVLAKNQGQAIDRAYQKIMMYFPKSDKSIWDIQVTKKQITFYRM